MGRFAPPPDEAVSDKISMSAYEGTFLNTAMRDLGLQAFAIVGIATEIGIEPTVRHGADLGFVPVIVTDACGAGHEESAHHALELLDHAGGAIFTSVDGISTLFRAGATGGNHSLEPCSCTRNYMRYNRVMDLRLDRTDEAGALLLDERRGRAWRTFLTAHAAVIDQIERGLAAEGEMPLGHYDVLLALDEAPGRRLRMNQLARDVVLSRSGLTRLVDRLEGAGLLERERCDDDRRGCYAVLTEDGAEALRRARPVYLRGVAEHFGRYLDDEEVRALDESLGRILAAARE